MDNVDDLFRASVRERRKELGLTQSELASRVGLDNSGIVRVERGGRTITLGLAYDLAKALDTSLTALLGNHEDDYEGRYRDLVGRFCEVSRIIERAPTPTLVRAMEEQGHGL